MTNCINLINISIKNNKKGFIITKNNNNINVLKAFVKIGVIKYVLVKNEYLIVYIKYTDEKPTYNNIINVFKSSKKKYISLKTLKKLSEKYNWLFILSTSKGIINSLDAIKLNVGGLLIAQIWN